MKVTLTYNWLSREVILEGVRLGSLSPDLREYVNDVLIVYRKHMKKLDNREIVSIGKLEIELEVLDKKILRQRILDAEDGPDRFVKGEV